MGPDGPFDQTLHAHLSAIQRELSELRDVIRGRPDIGWQGVLARVESSEKQVATLKEVQESFLRDRDAERARTEKRDASRTRITATVLTVFGAILSGIVIQLFVIMVNSGAHP